MKGLSCWFGYPVDIGKQYDVSLDYATDDDALLMQFDLACLLKSAAFKQETLCFSCIAKLAGVTLLCRDRTRAGRLRTLRTEYSSRWALSVE